MTAPTANDRYLLFQTLVGTWPNPAPRGAKELTTYRERIAHYMEKAIKEAKQHTSWINPNEQYDEAVRRFVAGALEDVKENEFLESFAPFAQRVARLGRFNSLAQLVLKLTSPGVPDIYQGNELWDFSLVDPDNRRQIDYGLRTKMLKTMLPMLDECAGDKLSKQVAVMFTRAIDGRIKMYLTARLLRYRRTNPEIFTKGSYARLAPVGDRADAVCAFERRLGDRVLIVAVCIRSAGVSRDGEIDPIGAAVWAKTFLSVPEISAGTRVKELLTGGELSSAAAEAGESRFSLGEVFATLPVAVIECTL
jgi:(1->4)-alpha-D-glucan 1-alpha-D-glucosylmutase